MVLLAGGQRRRLGRPLLDLHMRELAGDGAAEAGDQVLEELEALRLVFVERIALRVAAEADHRAQMVERREMLAPQMVERLQQHLLLDRAHQLRPEARRLARHQLVARLGDALADLVVGDAFLRRPVLDRKVEVELLLRRRGQPLDVPLLGVGALGDELVDHLVDDLAAHVAHGVAGMLVGHQLDALLEDDLALVVHHVVVFQQVLADVEVVRLDLRLRALQRLVDPGMDDRLALLEAELLQHPVHAVGAEDAHQVVLQRQEELRVPGVALAAGAAAQLVVDAAALVPLRADDVEAAGARLERQRLQPLDLGADLLLALVALRPFRHVGQLVHHAHVGVAAELDVGAAAGHVGGDRHRARNAGLRDDIGFLLVVARVQDGEDLALHRVAEERRERLRIGEIALLPAALAQDAREKLRLLDRGGADEHRLPARLAVLDQVEDRRVFLLRRAVDLVVVVVAHHRPVGRHLDHVEIVDVDELLRLGGGGAGHAGELLVEAEIVLEGDRGERLVLRLDLDVLLRLERLVQPVGIAPAFHHAAGELVDDDHLAVLDDVILVALEELVRAQRVVDVVDDRDVLHVVERAALQHALRDEHAFDLLRAFLGEARRAHLLVELVVASAELRDERVDGDIELRAVLGRAGDDERRARLVDQDGVDLVDDGVVVPALHHVLDVVFHVVAQVVEAELVVGAVGDVGGVGGAPLGRLQPVHDDADGEPEERVDAPHPFRVAAGEIVVDGDDVDAAAGERVQIDGEGGDEGLAFAGLHLGDRAFVQHHAADELHVEMPLAERALRRLAHSGEGVRQELVERSAVGDLLAELVGLGAKLGVAQPRYSGSRALIASTVGW